MDGGLLVYAERLSHRWVDWMVDITWQLALLVTVVGVLSWGLRRRSARLRYALWSLVLLRLVLPPTFAFPTGWAWWVSPHNSQVHAALGTNPPESAAETAVSGRPSPGLVLMTAWAAVVLTLLLRMDRARRRVRRWVNNARPVVDPALLSLLEDCRERLGIERFVDLRHSAGSATPLVAGVVRPVILLPESLSRRLDDDELQAVFLHELNHVARHDALLSVLQGLLSAVYFFHPLLWWAGSRMRQLREEACDELTVAVLDGRRKAYGSALVKIAELLSGALPAPVLGVAESPSHARRRLRRILDPRLPVSRSLGWPALLMTAATAAVLLPSGFRVSGAGRSPASSDKSIISTPARDGDDQRELPAMKVENRAGRQNRIAEEPSKSATSPDTSGRFRARRTLMF